MKTDRESRRAISRYAMAQHHHPDDHELHARLKAKYRAEQLVYAIKLVLAEVDLSVEDRHRIAATVLVGGTDE